MTWVNVLVGAIAILLVGTILYPLTSFDRTTHCRAIRKAFFILLLSSFPAVGVTILTGGISLIRPEELFIFAAAYLAPVIYWFYEAINESQENNGEVKGSWFLLLYSIFILLSTALIFGGFKANEDFWLSDYPVLIIAILITTLALWYFTVAFDKMPKNYVDKARLEETDFVKKITGGGK